MARGGGAADGLHYGGVCSERLAHLLRAWRRASRKPHRDGLGVTLYDRNARAARRDAEGRARMHVERECGTGAVSSRRGGDVLELAEDLERLPLHLLLLARYVRHDVVEDVERGHAGVSRARNSLQRRDDAGFYRTKGALERREGYDDACCGAVGVCDDEALFERGRVERALLRDYVEVERVDERDDEGHVRVAAIGLGVGEYCKFGSAKGSLCIRSGSIRKEREICGSIPISPATSASRPEKTTVQSVKCSGAHGLTSMSRTAGGIGVVCFQFAARAYVLPAERADAPRACTAKYGWLSRRAMKRWPTVPVAPSTPTLTILPSGTVYIASLRSGGSRDRANATLLTERVPLSFAGVASRTRTRTMSAVAPNDQQQRLFPPHVLFNNNAI